MNRKVFFILAALVFIAIAIVALFLPHNAHPPRFVPGTPASLPPFGADHYDWMGDVPFQNDQMWPWFLAGPFGRGRNGKTYTACTYLYDLRQQKVVGLLLNAGEPDLRSRDGSRILVSGYGPQPFSFNSILAPILKPFGINLPGPTHRLETYWTLDLSNNAAKRIDSISQYSGSGSTWHPSPDFRFGYTVPSTTPSSLCLCDLEQSSFTSIPFNGYARGWWDDHEIFIETETNLEHAIDHRPYFSHQFHLLDIRSKTTRPLFRTADFQSVLALAGITNGVPPISAMANWNGSGYDFYFGIDDQISGLQGTNSFLLKASASSPQLQLLYPHFAFKWGGHFDATGRFYLLEGESGQPGSGGNGSVYLRDLASGAVSTVVPPDNSGQYAIPRFYGNEVIYFHNRLIHRIGLNGSNDVPVLSPGK